MRISFFQDTWRGNGVQLSALNYTIALRYRWRFALVRPPGKPGYTRLYVGPIEIERRV